MFCLCVSSSGVCPGGSRLLDVVKCDGQNQCMKCDLGFKMVKTQTPAGVAPVGVCVKKKPCKCPHGTASGSKKDCDGQVMCITCEARYKLVRKTCVKMKPCSCPHGHAKNLPGCDGQVDCDKCNLGFKLLKSKCIKKKPCKCTGGKASTDLRICDGQLLCKSCFRNYIRQGTNACRKRKKCKCAHGSAQSDITKCDGQEFCVKCDVGWKLTKKKGITACGQKKKCVCPHGKPWQNKGQCDGQIHCVSCNKGYKLDNKCPAKKVTALPPGTGAKKKSSLVEVGASAISPDGEIWSALPRNPFQPKSFIDLDLKDGTSGGPPMKFFGHGCCRFNNWQKHPTHKGYQTEAACKNFCSASAACVAADIARPRGNKYDCYLFDGAGKIKNFRAACGKKKADKCFKKVKSRGKKRAASARPRRAAAGRPRRAAAAARRRRKVAYKDTPEQARSHQKGVTKNAFL